MGLTSERTRQATAESASIGLAGIHRILDALVGVVHQARSNVPRRQGLIERPQGQARAEPARERPARPRGHPPLWLGDLPPVRPRTGRRRRPGVRPLLLVVLAPASERLLVSPPLASELADPLVPGQGVISRGPLEHRAVARSAVTCPPTVRWRSCRTTSAGPSGWSGIWSPLHTLRPQMRRRSAETLNPGVPSGIFRWGAL